MNKPFASTYKQVVKNMTYVTKLIDTVFNDEAASDGMSDAYYDEALNSFKVLGISVDTEHLNDEELHPSDYTHDVTWRLKSSYVLGLGEYPLTGSKMILVTTRADGSNPYQLAYSTTHGACYFRAANTVEDYWEDWESAERNPIVRGSEFREKFVQLPGEYWVQPRDTRDVYDYQISTWEEYSNKSFNLFGALTVYDDPSDWDTRGQAVVKIKTTYHGTIDIMATAYTSEGQTVLSSEKVAVDDFSDPVILPFPKENLDTKIGYCKVFFFEHDGFVPALPALTLESHPNGSAIWYKIANHRYIKVYPETIAEVIHDPGGEDVVVQIEDIHNDITELQEDKIDKAGGTMEGTIDMGGNAITGLAAPVNDSDATTKEYVDEAIAGNGGIVIVDYDSDAAEAYEKIEEGYQLGKAIYVRYKDSISVSSYIPCYLALVDGPSVGLLGNKYYKFRAIHGGYEYIATLTKSPSSCSWDFETIEYLQTSGGAMSNDLNMDDHTISNLATPTNAADAATKEYVDGRYVTAGQMADTTLGNKVTAEGIDTTASGDFSHAEGCGTVADGYVSHAEGMYTAAHGNYTHAEGDNTNANEYCSHTEGCRTSTDGAYAHAEGLETLASGESSHAEGYNNIASGSQSHAEGQAATASGFVSHAEGYGTEANHYAQHVFGSYNIEDDSDASADEPGTYIEIVGNGSAYNNKSNARTLDWSGNEILAGKLTVGNGDAETGAPSNDADVTTKKYVDTGLSGKLDVSGGTLSGALNMNTNKITSLGVPSADTDASTKKYVDDGLSGKLNTSGGTMTGAIDMGSKKITSLATPTDDADAATKKYVDDTIGNMITAIVTAGTTAPSDTRLLWIDTTADTGGLKFYNGTSWVHVPVGYTAISSLSGLTGPTATPTPLNMIFTYGTTAPSDTRLLWIDTSGSTGGLKFHNGSSWVHVPVSYN